MNKVMTEYLSKLELGELLQAKNVAIIPLFSSINDSLQYLTRKIENLEHAIALQFMHYNFGRPHKTLTPKNSVGVTPAMAAGISNHIWTIGEIVELVGK